LRSGGGWWARSGGREGVELQAQDGRGGQGHAAALGPQHRLAVGAPAEQVAALDLDAVTGNGGRFELVDGVVAAGGGVRMAKKGPIARSGKNRS